MNNIRNKITSDLFSLRDEKFASFHKRLIPTVPEERIIGVRIPMLRKYAKELPKSDADAFLSVLVHDYYDENTLHAILLQQIDDADRLFFELERFLPYIDNWATCDCLRPKILAKCKPELLLKIRKWLKSGHTYTVRFAVEMLMLHFLREDFKREYLEYVSKIRSDEYYIKMMCAWYFAEALVWQYEEAVVYFERGLLDVETMSMAVKKARESFRISDLRKDYLRKLCTERENCKNM